MFLGCIHTKTIQTLVHKIYKYRKSGQFRAIQLGYRHIQDNIFDAKHIKNSSYKEYKEYKEVPGLCCVPI